MALDTLEVPASDINPAAATKYCGGCGRVLSVDQFNINRTHRDGLQSQCRPCDNRHRRNWYRKTGKRYNITAYVRSRKREIREWVWKIKSGLRCEMCGEDHPATLDFHHKDPAQKILRVSQMVAKGCSRAKILIEIKKCMVMCSNCHRKLHYKEKNDPIAQG